MATAPAERLNLATLAESGIDVVQMEIVDLDGALRGKFLPVAKAKPDSKGSFCTIVYQLTSVDDVWITRHSSFDNGFPDMVARPDPETAVRWGWRPGTAAVIYDMFNEDGTPHAIAP